MDEDCKDTGNIDQATSYKTQGGKFMVKSTFTVSKRT